MTKTIAKTANSDKFGGDALVIQAREGEKRMLAKLEDCQAALQQAREALKHYGMHNFLCTSHLADGVCDCGLDAALKDEGR